MLSPFIKGLMCATLFYLGIGSVSVVIGALGRHETAASLVGYLPGVLALPLALSLFSRSQLAARLAFGTLAVLSLMYIVAPVVAAATGKASLAPPRRSVAYAVIYAFPCLSAVLLRKRSVGERSNQAMQRTAPRSDV